MTPPAMNVKAVSDRNERYRVTMEDLADVWRSLLLLRVRFQWHAIRVKGADRALMADQQVGERGGIDRLRQMVIEACVARALLVLFLSPAGHRHNQHRLMRDGPPDATADFVTVHAGHPDI